MQPPKKHTSAFDSDTCDMTSKGRHGKMAKHGNMNLAESVI